MVFERLSTRTGHAYLVLAFFVLPVAAVIATGESRRAGPLATVVLWTVVIHHGLFVATSVLD
ncbi:hypothetical protein [Halolamina sp.]|jgi:hypothetical protein|uniref:hypothetical protein n=1 Tax=Halolamina sp. TaxID=1940283 RepID=UPI000223B57E|nr:hypothetical protein Halar_1089 [halophilic archaeon DL31]